MAKAKSRRPWLWLASLGFVLFMALVVYRSLHVAGYQCEVCIQFRGNSSCRTVEGPTEQEARTGAVTNTCAQLTSGVTETMACERTMPQKSSCTPLN